MDKVRCLICGKDFQSQAGLHRHLTTTHAMIHAEYYHRFFPRYDKLTGALIIYENARQYFETDFNTKSGMRTWIQKASPEEARKYFESILLARKARKQLVYTPCQVELRSLFWPGILYLNGLFGNYYQRTKELGFTNRYSQLGFSGIWNDFSKNHTVLVDTREQMPLEFRNIRTINSALNFGDYQLNDDKFTHKCCIERKSVGDFLGTLIIQPERFERELERAREAGYYMVVVVEGTIEEVREFNLKMSFAHINVPLEYALSRMRMLCQTQNFLQFLFVKNREESSEAILRLFQSNGQYRKLDIQYAYDSGSLL
jgi:ERCC4-type nuclease